MKSKTFALDIGTTSIKAVWMGKQGNQLSVEAVIASPIDQKGMLSESFVEQKKFSEFVKGLLTTASITTRNVNLALPEHQVYSKILEMPELSEKELSLALKFEMEQNIPLPLDQIRTDYEILGHRDQDGKKVMDVLVVAAPTSTLEKFEKIIQMIELKPSGIETEVTCVIRGIMPLLSPNSNDLLVHLGASTTSVAILRNKTLHQIFSIPLGGIAITRAVSIDLGIEMNQAESFKKVYGLTQDVFEGKIGKALAPVLTSILSDIRKGVFSFQEKNQGETIKQIILSGGSAMMPGLDVYFTSALDAQVLIANAWQINSVANVPKEVMEEGPSYNVVAGLALRDLL